MKIAMLLLPLMALGACAPDKDQSTRPQQATVYGSAGGGLANVPVTTTGADGIRSTTTNNLYVP